MTYSSDQLVIIDFDSINDSSPYQTSALYNDIMKTTVTAQTKNLHFTIYTGPSEMSSDRSKSYSNRIDSVTAIKYSFGGENYYNNGDKTILCLLSSDSSIFSSSSKSQKTTRKYYIEPSSNEGIDISPKEEEFYIVEDRLYKTRAEKEQIITPAEGQVALYINNKEDVRNQIKNQDQNEEVTSKGSNRLLCCAVNYNNDIFNIFSILKEGHLYMGGSIDTDEKDVSKLPDSIKISSPLIEINSHTGNLLMSFGNIIDVDTGMNLRDYVTDEIEAAALVKHKHQVDSDFLIEVKSETGLHWFKADQKTKIYSALNSATSVNELK